MRLKQEKRLSYEYCTLMPSDNVISTQNVAEKVISALGFRGTVDLYRVIIAPNREMVCWVCKCRGRIVHIRPVFVDADSLPLGRRYEFKKLTGGELFCYNDVFYRTYSNDCGCIGIRAVLIFPDERLVRTACQLKGYNVVTVTPVRVLDDATRKYLAPAWCVRCMDCNTDFAIIFMDSRDGLGLEGYDLVNNAVYKNLAEEENFLAGKTYYKVKKNNVGEWYLVKSRMQVELGGKFQ